MRKIIYLLSFITTAYAQQIVILDNYEPIKLIGDTLFINKEGYDLVKVVKPYEGYKPKKWQKFVATYYLPITDSLRETGKLADWSETVASSIRITKGYDKNKCHSIWKYNSLTEFYREVSVVCKDCSWTMEIANFGDYGFKSIYTAPTSEVLEPSMFPGLKQKVDSLAMLLNYSESQTYNFNFYFDKKMDVTIGVDNECTAYQLTKHPNTDLSDIEEYLENLKWPVLKIGSKIIPYTIKIEDYSYAIVTNIKAYKEMNNGYKSCIKVFDDPGDSLFAIVDTFNNQTVFYEVRNSDHDKYYTRKYIDIKEYYPGLIDIIGAPRIDIDNDGLKDILIDTINDPDKHNRICFIPHPMARRWNYRSIFDHIYYYKDLGNHYFYDFVQDHEVEDNVRIFKVEKGKVKDVVSFYKSTSPSRDYYRHDRIVWGEPSNLHNTQYNYYSFVKRNPRLSGSIKNPKKAVEKKEKLIEIVQNYLDHPEQLPRDFEKNK